MAIIATINDIDMFKELESEVDAIIVPTPFSSYVLTRFNLEEIKYIVNIAEKPLYFLVNGLYEDKDMEGVRDLILEYKDQVHYIFGDLGVLDILIDFSLENRSIYNPTTLICNSLDANEYLDYGLEAVGLSNEITVNDQVNITKKVNNKTLIKVFGFHPMFISKRKLITTYLEHINKEKKTKKGYLVEERRPDKLPVIEDIDGTTIYRHYPINLIKEIDSIKTANFLYFNSTFLSTKTLIETVRIYKKAINNEISSKEAFEILSSMFLYSDGFMYNDSIYEERDF